MTRRSRKIRLLAAVALGMIILAGAGDDTARVEKLGHKVICMCGCNQVLLECNHYGCPYLTPEHQAIIAAVDKGEDDSTILRAFIEQYGPTVLAAPTKKGFDLVAWIIPYVALAFGAGLVLIVISWHRRPSAVQVTGGPAKSPTELDRFRAQARKETEI